MNIDAQRGYAGTSPGQNLATLLARLTIRDLQIIIGPRVLPLLPVTPKGDRTVRRLMGWTDRKSVV